MTESIIVALITGGLSLIGILISNRTVNQKTMAEIAKAQAVTDTKIDELTRETRKHNGLIERTYALEARADLTDEKIKVANHRIDDLEKGAKA